MNSLQKSAIFVLGWMLSISPRFLLIGLCKILAIVALAFLAGRRKLVLSNLMIGFPKFTRWERLIIAFRSVSNSVEQGLLLFVWPHFNEAKLKLMFSLDEPNLNKLKKANGQKPGVLWLIPHFCHADALSITPLYIGEGHGVHALYRPLRNEVVNSFVKSSRERFEVVTIDRKDGGMLKTLRVLKKGYTLATLFDQNAGGAGTKLKFFGKYCSCTTLPDILAEKYKPHILFVYTRRTGFWKSVIEVEEMGELGTNELVIEKANRWLENKLRNDVVLCESWLWMHQRWKPNVGQSRKGRIR
jgi:lauroyl/myristoyl acyltransferase